MSSRSLLPRFSPTFFAVFVLLSLCLVFAFMVYGVQIEKFSFANVYVKNASLTWDKGFKLEVAQIRIDEQKGRNGTKAITGSGLKKRLEALRILRKFIPSLTVHSFTFKGYNGEILTQGKSAASPLRFSLNSDDLHLIATYQREQENIRIVLQKASSTRLHSSATGTLQINPETFQTQAELQLNLAGCLSVLISAQADVNEISFQGQGRSKSTTITPLVNLFSLHPDVQCWITEYLKGSSYSLQSVYGKFPWDNPAVLLKTLTASIKINDTEYTFAQGLKPIKAEYTDVTFTNGILNIIPHNSSFYSQDGGSSWLDINFNDPDNILLTAYIKTRAQANADIVNLANYYDLSLPFSQTKGTVDTDLTLAINLSSSQVDASGVFTLGPSTFLFEGQPFLVRKGRIELKGADVHIKELELGYKKILIGRISGLMNFEESRTDLDIALDSVSYSLRKRPLTLHPPQKKPLQLNYHLRDGQATLTVAPSQWFLGTKKLTLDSFTVAPFNFQQLSGTIPPTHLVVSSLADLLISGNFDGRKQLADMTLNLHHLQTQSVALVQESLPLKVKLDQQELHVSSRQKSRWLATGREFCISPFEIWYSRDQLKIGKVHLQSGNFVGTFFSGDFDLFMGKGKFHLDELFFAKKKFPHLFDFPHELILDVETKNGETKVHLDRLGFYLCSEPQGVWRVGISDLRKLLKNSNLLRRLKINNGSLHLVTASASAPLQFKGSISSAYAFFIQDGKPLSKYVFSGRYDETGLDMEINGDFYVHYSDTIQLRSRDIGFNLPDLLRLKKDQPKQEQPEEKKVDYPEITLQASNSFFFLRTGNTILMDRLDLAAKGEKISLKIYHGQGEITAHVIGDTFFLRGQQLDETFINALIIGADFEDGTLDAVVEGTFDNFTGVFSTGPGRLKNYAVLNNILAAINTLPALMTLSLPRYDPKGWPVDAIHLWADYNKGMVTFKSLEIDSAEMDMRGTGTIDLLHKKINLDVNMITQAGQNMSKIPLVGYILAGEEQRPTLTFHVTGDLYNPVVNNTAFEEVMVMPFKMIYRTLNSPFKWADQLMHQEAPQAQQSIKEKSVQRQRK